MRALTPLRLLPLPSPRRAAMIGECASGGKGAGCRSALSCLLLCCGCCGGVSPGGWRGVDWLSSFPLGPCGHACLPAPPPLLLRRGSRGVRRTPLREVPSEASRRCAAPGGCGFREAGSEQRAGLCLRLLAFVVKALGAFVGAVLQVPSVFSAGGSVTFVPPVGDDSAAGCSGLAIETSINYFPQNTNCLYQWARVLCFVKF